MNRTLTILAALALSGCASLDGKLENRIACTVARDKAHVISEWGPVGLATVISPKDAAVICK
jgi:hypothetical protein